MYAFSYIYIYIYISYFMAIVTVMFVLSLTISNTFADEMCMTLTIKMGHGQMYICQSKAHMQLPI